MVKIILNGYFGKMGRVINELVSKSDKKAEIVAGVDLVESGISLPFPTYTDIFDCDMPADVIVDFTHPSSLPRLVEYAHAKKMPIIICTTGLTPDDLQKIEKASAEVPIFRSANMSLGINLIVSFLEKAGLVLQKSDFDIEIVEKHHNQKLDAPSGTALLLADAINNSSESKYDYMYDRTQQRQKRNPNEIGIHSIRGGTIIGEHSVIFAGNDEIIEISHTALSRNVFATGALRAAIYMKGKPPGLYSMSDLMEDEMQAAKF